MVLGEVSPPHRIFTALLLARPLQEALVLQDTPLGLAPLTPAPLPPSGAA